MNYDLAIMALERHGARAADDSNRFWKRSRSRRPRFIQGRSRACAF